MSILISRHIGHTHRGKLKNPYEIWKDDKGEYVKMFTDKNSFIFDKDDLDKILYYIDDDGDVKNITWHAKKEVRIKDRESYYIRGGYKNNKKVYFHKLIMNYLNPDDESITIDHIDRNPLNNRKYNLRFATKTIQNKNTHKRSRMKNACKLPEYLKNIQLPKYVCYTRYNRNTKLGYYELFVIQCHPNQKKNEKWSSRMSMKLSLIDKLNETLEKLKELDNLK